MARPEVSGHLSYKKDGNIPFFFGPLHMIASSGLDSKNPMDITDKLSSTYCKKHTPYITPVLTTIRPINILNEQKMYYSKQSFEVQSL
jgi:hypothetical protein